MTYYEKLSLENYFGRHHHQLNSPQSSAIVIDKGTIGHRYHNQYPTPFELAASASLTKFNYVPAIVPIPTIRADDRDLAFKVHFISFYNLDFMVKVRF